MLVFKKEKKVPPTFIPLAKGESLRDTGDVRGRAGEREGGRFAPIRELRARPLRCDAPAAQKLPGELLPLTPWQGWPHDISAGASGSGPQGRWHFAGPSEGTLCNPKFFPEQDAIFSEQPTSKREGLRENEAIFLLRKVKQ